MRSSRRQPSLIALAAFYMVVMAAGPSLHGLIGLDHGTAWDSDPAASVVQSQSHSGDDCAVCHLFSLAQHTPDVAAAYSAPRVERISKPVRTSLPALEFRTLAPARAPPAV